MQFCTLKLQSVATVLQPFSGDVVAAVESVWSGVVSGTQAAVLPAYRPLFQPVPPLHSASNIDTVRSSTPPSKHSQQRSPSSSSSQLSREDVCSEQAGAGNNYDSRHLSPAAHGPAADSSLQREESSDSGGVYTTPTSNSHVGPNLELESSTVICRNSTDLPVKSLVNVGRQFRRLGDDGDVEYRSKDFAAGLISQNSSPSDLGMVADVAGASSNYISDAVQFRSNSCCGVLYHRPDEPFVSPSKPVKKTKKSRRSSQPGQTSCTSGKSILAYGGNPKWIWKN